MEHSDPRAPLDQARFEGVAAPWRIRVVDETESTNTDLLAAAAAGEAEGAVLVAEYQHAGRGRLGRSWESPRYAGLIVSLLLRPTVAPARWGWLPLLAGVALADTIGATARLKWPNDLLLGPELGKAAGILVQAGAGAVVVGVGVNVDTRTDELPVDTATSLVLTGHPGTDRAALLLGFLDQFSGRFRDWQLSAGDAQASGLAADYRSRCATLGTEVSVQLPGSTINGAAVDLDSDGRLVLDVGGARSAIAAGDVTHLRPAP